MAHLRTVFVIIGLLLSGVSASATPISQNPAMGALYQEAKIKLSAGDYEYTKGAIAKLKKDRLLNPWAIFLETDALLSLGKVEEAKHSVANLKINQDSKLQKLYKLKYELELDLSESNQSSKNLSAIFTGIQQLKSARTLRGEIEYLSALLNIRKRNFKIAIPQLQNIRINFPSTPTSKKSKALIEHTFKSNPSLKNSLRTRDFHLREIKGELANNRVKAAYDLISSAIKAKLLADQSDKDVFQTKLIILKAGNHQREMKLYLESLSASSGPLKYSALSEQAMQAWNRNDSAELTMVLKKLGNSPFSSYLEARVAEESGYLEKAKNIYSWLFRVRGHKYLQQTGLRLSWLQLQSRESSKATQTLQRLKQIDDKQSYYDTESINFWLDKAQGKKGTSTTSYNWDPRLYYYWLNHNSSPGRAFETVLSTEIINNVKNRSCDLKATPVQIGNIFYIKQLASYNILPILEDELELSLPKRINAPNEIFSRAKFAQQIGAPTLAIKEIRAFPKTYYKMEHQCLKDILNILYPREHEDIFKAESERTGVDKNLLMAITRTESTFDPMAVSRVGAMGLMQLMPATAELEGFTGFKEGNPHYAFLPEQNIRLGANHLQRLMNKYGEHWHLTIAAYNAGGQAVDRWLKRYPNASEQLWIEMINYKETRHYVKKVLGAYWAYRISEALK
jgi:hypothetical protein